MGSPGTAVNESWNVCDCIWPPEAPPSIVANLSFISDVWAVLALRFFMKFSAAVTGGVVSKVCSWFEGILTLFSYMYSDILKMINLTNK